MNFGLTGVYDLSSISKTLHNFYNRMYRGTLKLKKGTSILCKNGLLTNKTCCTLTALLVKTKIYFCCCNSGNKQIKQNS